MKYLKKYQEFKEFLLEANQVLNYSTPESTDFSAIFIKNYLIVVDQIDNYISQKDKDQAKEETGFSLYSADLVLNIKKRGKLISLPSTGSVVYNVGKYPKYLRVEAKADKDLILKSIKELQRHKIIDSSYKFLIDANNTKEKVKTSDLAIKFTSNDIILYHGTSSNAAFQILKKGLTPLDTKDMENKSMFRGNPSDIKNYTSKNVYLTPSIDTAKHYAFRQAQHLKSEPVVFRIIIPDKDKLIVDDDYLLKELQLLMIEKINKEYKFSVFNKEKNSVLFDEMIKYLEKNLKDYDDLITDLTRFEFYQSKMLKYPAKLDTDYIHSLIQNNMISLVVDGKFENKNVKLSSYNEYYSEFYSEYTQLLFPDVYEIIQKNIKKEYTKIINTYWKKSAFGRIQAVAYNGRILPKFISVIEDLEYKLK